MVTSIVIRTLNESLYLTELLEQIKAQSCSLGPTEVVVIDSGSTDETLSIAEAFGCNIAHIAKSDFTFGRSLNEGCEYSSGEILVFISGHCIPCDEHWLENLISPIQKGLVDYSYGRQVGRDTTKFSEQELFKKYFSGVSRIPQEGFFVNNANSAIRRSSWQKFKFDESLTGLEDLELSKRLVADGGKVGYCANASVFHIHDEQWSQTLRRYEREAYALQTIMPEIHVNAVDMFRYIFVGIINDAAQAVRRRVFLREVVGILRFRVAQYLGTYRGNHLHRAVSRERKEDYFYPRVNKK
jgi:rhamnosyltransferase